MKLYTVSYIDGQYLPSEVSQEEAQSLINKGYRVAQIPDEISNNWHEYCGQQNKWHLFWRDIDHKLWGCK